MTTTCPTPASRARARTASRSGSNAASPRWQWASTSPVPALGVVIASVTPHRLEAGTGPAPSHGRFGADPGAAPAPRCRGRRVERDGTWGPQHAGATRVLARPALLDVHQERSRDVDRRE